MGADSKPSLLDCQWLLTQLGFHNGFHDGLMGPATRLALLGFQHAVGIEECGELSPNTYLALVHAREAWANTADRDIALRSARVVMHGVTPEQMAAARASLLRAERLLVDEASTDCAYGRAIVRAVEQQIATQEFPFPHELAAAVDELQYLPGWTIVLADEDRGQDCKGLTLTIYPDKPDSYHPENHVRTRFLFPVPGAAFNRESWEEWLWARIEDVENHERAEWFRFGDAERRPFKPAHPDGWDPSVVRTVVSETVTNTPNAGRLVRFPCVCGHDHNGRMGEHFRIEAAWPCPEEDCACELGHSS